jgi:hypothetical protein
LHRGLLSFLWHRRLRRLLLLDLRFVFDFRSLLDSIDVTSHYSGGWFVYVSGIFGLLCERAGLGCSHTGLSGLLGFVEVALRSVAVCASERARGHLRYF